MKTLKNENLQELTEKVLDLIAKTSVEIGHKIDANTMASLSKIFAQDLQKENRFKNLTFNQIQDAFHQGVRFSKDEPFLFNSLIHLEIVTLFLLYNLLKY